MTATCPHTNIHMVNDEWQCKKCSISFGFGKNPTREPYPYPSRARYNKAISLLSVYAYCHQRERVIVSAQTGETEWRDCGVCTGCRAQKFLDEGGKKEPLVETAPVLLEALKQAALELQRLRNVLLPHYEGKIGEPCEKVLTEANAIIALAENKGGK